MYTIQDLNVRLLSELKEIAEEIGLDNFKKLPKKELIYKILDHQAANPTSPKASPKTSATAKTPAIEEKSKPPRVESKKRLILKRENVKKKKPEQENVNLIKISSLTKISALMISLNRSHWILTNPFLCLIPTWRSQ